MGKTELSRVLNKLKTNGTTNIQMKEALLGENKELREIPLSSLRENPYQPRIEIKPEEIKDLADSIREKGLLQPILVAKADTGYYIVAGHRRVEAHKWLGKEKIKARVIKANKEDLASMSLIENLQREDLDLIETAMALKKYKEEFGKTLEEIGKEIGKTKGYVSQILNILNLPDEIIKDIKENKTTKDVTALNWLNSYAKKKFSMLNKSTNPQEIEDKKQSEKIKNEILELYQGFLTYGRGWLKDEIDKRLKSVNRIKKPDMKLAIGKRKTKIEINMPLTKEAEEKLKNILLEIALELKADNVEVKDFKKRKKKPESKPEPIEETKKTEPEIDYDEANKILDEMDAELDELLAKCDEEDRKKLKRIKEINEICMPKKL